MAPGKGRKAPKPKPKGVGVDFKKVKYKVGRKLPPPKNETKLDFTTKSIVLPEQSIAQNKEGVALNLRRQSLKDLLTQSTHYSERVRKEALLGIKDLISRHPAELALRTVTILEKLAPRITDGDKSVRQAFLLLIRSTIFPGLPEAKMGPLVPVMMAHLCSAMTHMTTDIRLTAFAFLDLLVFHYPSLVVPVYTHEITQHYMNILGRGGVNKQASDTVLKLLCSLEQFLFSLKSVSSQSAEGTLSSMVHRWGEKYDLNKQDSSSPFSALHSYRSMVKQGRDNVSKLGSLFSNELSGKTEDGSNARDERSKRAKTLRDADTAGNSSESSTLAASLAPLLLDCWTEFSPSVCAGPTPDSSNLSCMVCITRCLKLLLDLLLNSPSKAQGPAMTGRFSQMGVAFENDRGRGRWMHKHLLPGFLHHLMASFPMTASSVQLTVKVEEGVVALNVGICEVMLPFITTYGAKTEKEQLSFDSVLQYFHCALHGMMLPSSGLSSAVIDSKLAEPHIKSLLGYLPQLILCLPKEWASELLETFTTHVFQRSRAQSALKLACLSVMVKMLLRQGNGADSAENAVNIPFEVQKHWLQSLPKLLWELKHTHPSVSQAVLRMLLHIGQTAPEGSLLLEEYTALQPVMTPFFYTSLTSKNSQSRSIYGPFVKLPETCQQLAVDLLYYYKSFSPSFLKAVAQCCLSPEVDVKVAMRVMEVLQRAFCRGAISLPDHLSFLVTLLAGHTSISPDSVLATAQPVDSMSDQVTGKYMEKKQVVIGGVVCTCLTQLGDESLILQLLAPSLQHELTLLPSVDVEHAILRVIGVLSQGGKRLPSTLAESLPKLVAKFTRSVHEAGAGDSDAESVKEFLLRPCIVVLSRNASLAGRVLEEFASLLKEAETETSTFARVYRTVLQVLLRLFKDEKVANGLSSSKASVESILQMRRVIDKSAATEEIRQVEKLLLELENATATLYGWKL